MKKLLIFSYVIFLIIFTLFSYLFIDPNLLYLKNFYTGIFLYNRLFVTVGYSVLIVIYVGFYLLFLKLWKMNVLTKLDIKILIGVTCILILAYPAMVSYDIFNYVFTSKVLYFYHENPYIIMPIQFVNDPLLSFTRATNKIALYGPSWIGLSVLPYLLGFGNFLVTLLNFKLLVGLFYLLATWIIKKLSKDFLSVILFALNPLIAIETLISGHNDIVLIFFALLSIFLVQKKKLFLSAISLVISIFIKYSTVFLVPIFFYSAMIYKNKVVNWEKIYVIFWSLMMVAFLLAPIREEIYPWYAIWFLPFAILSNNKIIMYISLAFSFCLPFTYLPFMYLGTYSSPTPFIRTMITFAPVFLVIIFSLIRNKQWLKKFYR